MNPSSFEQFLFQALEMRLTNCRILDSTTELTVFFQLIQLLNQLQTPMIFSQLTLKNINIKTASMLLRFGTNMIHPDEYQRILHLTIQACQNQKLDPQCMLVGIISNKDLSCMVI